MRTLLILLLCLSLTASATKYYISPDGNDANPGTYASPKFKLEAIWSSLTAGDTLYCIGGTYGYTDQQILTGKSGTAGNMIKVWSYNSTPPKFIRNGGNDNDFNDGRACSLIYFSGDYVWFKNLEFANFPQWKALAINTSFAVDNSDNCIFELFNCHDSGHGFLMRNQCTGNLILNGDFHHNKDPLSTIPYNNADGIEICENTDTNAVNTIRGCRMYWNTDDGVDTWYNNGTVIFDNCWTFYNGYLPGTFTGLTSDGTEHLGNGFKLGQTSVDLGYRSKHRYCYNCLAFKNYATGFTHNSGRCGMVLFNNTAYLNQCRGIDINLSGYVNSLKNNIGFGNVMLNLFTAASDSFSDHNTFTKYGGENSLYSITADDFYTDTTGITAGRKADGSLPGIILMHLKTGSDLIDTGVDVGYGNDLGYVQYTTPGIVLPPPPKGVIVKESSGKVVRGITRILKR